VNAETTLDRIDRKILAALQAEGRISNQALSERVALSPSACLARVRRLEHTGIIQGYHARIDPFAVDVGIVLFAEVSLKANGAQELRKFEAALTGVPQIVEASHVSGDFDYLLKAVVNELPEWSGITELLTSDTFGADRVVTHVILSKPRIFTGYPVQI
jgi:Lrp/AsnC family transcriptional regulator, leucine-responsive regulatory protein